MESEEKTFRKLMTPLRVVSGGYTPQIVEADGACVSHVTSWGSANINPELSRYVSMDEALFRANEIVSAVNELATLRAENAAMKAQLEEANHGLAVSEKLRHKVGADCDYYQKKLAASEAKRKVLARDGRMLYLTLIRIQQSGQLDVSPFPDQGAFVVSALKTYRDAWLSKATDAANALEGE